MSTAAKITPIRVLSVSADAGLSASRELLLRDHGYTVTTSLSKEHALHAIRFQQFHLLILGNSLTPETCMELGQRFRARNPQATIIEILGVHGDPPKNQPDETVVSLDGPDVLLHTIKTATTQGKRVEGSAG